MRLTSSRPVIAAAVSMVHKVMETYAALNQTSDDPEQRAKVGPPQNLTITPAPQMTSRLRRSGDQIPPSWAQSSVPITLPLLHTRLAGAPVLPPGGVTPPDPDQYGTFEWRKVASVHQVIHCLGMYWKFSCMSHW